MISRLNILHAFTLVLLAILSTSLRSQDPIALKPLQYNHPGLVVDLGVGLWAWPIPCDADNDGDFDLIVSCPDVPSNGIWLFENDSQDATQAMPIFRPGRKLSRTIHYVMPSYQDGKLRVLSPGREYLQFTQSGIENSIELPVDHQFYSPRWTQSKGPKIRHRQWRYVDYDGDGVTDLVAAMEDWSDYGWDDAWNEQGNWTNGPLHGFLFLFHNRGSNQQPQYDPPQSILANHQPIDVFGCPSPNFEDWDNDGDLDLICGEFLDGFTYFENQGTRSLPVFATGVRLQNMSNEPLVMNLQMIVPIAFDWDRDGDADLIVGDEDGRVAFVECLGMRSDRTPQFQAPRYFQQQADALKCGALATPFGVDWDSDGDTDLVSGNTSGTIEIFLNLGPIGSNEPRWEAPQKLMVDGKPFRIQAGSNGSIQGPAEAKWGYTTLNVRDWDGDGLHDIVFNSILGKVQWLKNVGSSTVPRFTTLQDIEVDWEKHGIRPLPKPAWTWWNPKPSQLATQWRTTPVLYDFNSDGLMDLAMLDPEGYLALYERQPNGQLAPPKRVFHDENGKPLRLNERRAGGSGRRKLCIVDWNGDGRFDWLLNSANADFLMQIDSPEGSYRFKNMGKLVQQNIEGHDVSPTTVDFNQDGIPDLVGGAEDGRMYFWQQTRGVEPPRK